VLIVILVWTAVRLYEWIGIGKQEPKAVLYLLQVSAFQQQMLAGALQDSGGAKESGQLNALARAVYSAQYSHERLQRAAAAGEVPGLAVYRELLSCLTGLQLSGNRPLTDAEKALLAGAAEQFKAFAQSYAEMLGGNREWNRKEIEKLKKQDTSIVQFLTDRQFEVKVVS